MCVSVSICVNVHKRMSVCVCVCVCVCSGVRQVWDDEQKRVDGTVFADIRPKVLQASLIQTHAPCVCEHARDALPVNSSVCYSR